MNPAILKQLADSIQQMPSLPVVAVKLIDIAKNKTAHLDEIVRLIEMDPALSSKVLKISNSADFQFSSRVKTVSHAVQLLGTDLVRAIALSVIVFRLFKDLPASQFFDMALFWNHSMACAIGAELIARKFQYPHPQEAFTAGLLHDVGKLIFYQGRPKEYEANLELSQRERIPIAELETKSFGIDHAELAHYLLSKWNFPEILTTAIRFHHQPPTQFETDRVGGLPWIIHCANRFCNLQRFSSGSFIAGMNDFETFHEETGFSRRDIESLTKNLMARFETVTECFDQKGTTLDLYLTSINLANSELSGMMTEMTLRNRHLSQQCRILEAIRQMTEVLPEFSCARDALQKILEVLSGAIPHGRLLGFILRAEGGILEGSWKSEPGKPWISFSHPIPAALGIDVTHFTLEQQAICLQEAFGKQADESPEPMNWPELSSPSELAEALQQGRLALLPMSANGAHPGQILLEIADTQWENQKSRDLLLQFGGAAGLAIQRVLLLESSQRQEEEVLRIMRRMEETKTKLGHMERLSSVGRLAAGAAHEINNPLSIISGRAQLLLQHLEKESDRRATEIIIEQSARIAKIIHDMMGLARPAEPNFESISLAPILRKITLLLESRMKAAGIQVREEYDESLPPVYADEKQLEQVFLNLVVNAIQAMSSGGAILIRVQSEPERKRICIEIQDNGAGISEKDLRCIFDPFFTTKKEGEGTGLGLAICQSIIQAHHGEISVSSRLGVGTCFQISLPVSSGYWTRPVADAGHSVSEASKRSGAFYGSILVVDDEEDILCMLKEALSRKGYEVAVAGDGVQGLEELEQHPFDLVLLDLRMPKKAGFEVLKAIRQLRPQLPVIVISGVAHENEFSDALKMGAMACLKKPFDVTELLTLIARCLQTSTGILEV